MPYSEYTITASAPNDDQVEIQQPKYYLMLLQSSQLN